LTIVFIIYCLNKHTLVNIYAFKLAFIESTPIHLSNSFYGEAIHLMELNETYHIILLSVFALAGLIHLSYYIFVFSRFAFHRQHADNKEPTKQPVSVIICAKNEAINLRKYLHSVLEQEYPNYEVVVVNDCSWDETGSTLEEIQKQYSHLKIVTIPEQDKYRHGKKFAVALGIKAAKNEILLFTDADCMPVSKNWIELIQSNFTKEKEIVLGYGAYKRERGFLNLMIRFDTLMIAMQYFSFALGRNAYMGVGRNMAYRKTLFFQKKGFASHNHLFSGDDDLFVNENATPSNIAIEASSEAFTVSEPKKTFAEWLTQKRRHGTTSRYYKASHKFQLSLIYLSNLIFFLLLITLLILRYRWQLVLGIYLVKLAVQWIISYMASKKLKEKGIIWVYPVLEMIFIVLQPVFFISSLFTKQQSWK